MTTNGVSVSQKDATRQNYLKVHVLLTGKWKKWFDAVTVNERLTFSTGVIQQTVLVLRITGLWSNESIAGIELLVSSKWFGQPAKLVISHEATQAAIESSDSFEEFSYSISGYFTDGR